MRDAEKHCSRGQYRRAKVARKAGYMNEGSSGLMMRLNGEALPCDEANPKT